MKLNVVFTVSSLHNISFEHDVETEDVADWLGEDTVDAYFAGELTENDILDRLWAEKDYIQEVLNRHVEIDLRLEEASR